MNIDLSWWGRLVGLLAAEALLLVSVAGLAARVLRSPQSQRTVWQAALLGIAILWVGECADARRLLARFLPLEDPIRRLSAHVLDSLPGESLNDGVPEEPRAIPSPAALQAGPVWWPGELWLAGFALLMARLVLIRAGLAWCVLRLRSKHPGSEQQQGGSPSLPYDPTSAESPNVEWITDRLCLPLGLPRVRVLVWPRLRGPVAFSVFCPTVALPEDFDQRFTPVQREAMLAHELAHLTARDPMWLALTDFVCALAWWHPAIWWARRNLREASETAADEAAALVPGGRAALAESLVVFGRELVAPGWVRDLGVAGDGLKSQLAQRIGTLLAASGEWRALRPGRVWAMRASATGLVGALLLTPWPGGSGGGFLTIVEAARADETAATIQTKSADQPAPAVGTVTSDPNISPPSRSSEEHHYKSPGDTRQLLLEVQFAEITERNLDDLGLDWLFGQSPTNNPALQSGPATNLLTEPGSPHGQNLRVDLLRTEGQSATLTTTQFAALRKRLKEIGGVDFLAAPKISTLSGRQARIEVSEMITIVNYAQAIPGSANTKAHINYQTESVSTGPSVDITPTLEGNTAKLAIVAKVTEFLGYDQPTESQSVLATQQGEKPVKGTLPLPRLRVRSAQATAFVNFDDTMVLRGPLVTERLRTKDKVPVLGDLPLVGRLFRNEGETTIRKRLYIFVTPVELTSTGEKR